MIDQHLAFSIQQQPGITNISHKVRDNKIEDLEPMSNEAGIKSNKDEIKKVAKEMESLFAYQLLKIMRETTANMSDEKKENGYDTYMGMFDMEVSKLLADRGLGLQENIINWLERSQGINEKEFNSKG